MAKAAVPLRKGHLAVTCPTIAAREVVLHGKFGHSGLEGKDVWMAELTAIPYGVFLV